MTDFEAPKVAEFGGECNVLVSVCVTVRVGFVAVRIITAPVRTWG